MSLATDLLAQATHLVQLRQSDRSRRHPCQTFTIADFFYRTCFKNVAEIFVAYVFRPRMAA